MAESIFERSHGLQLLVVYQGDYDMHPFEEILSVSVEDIEFALRGCFAAEWASFVLNPRRLRGSDFLMRWSQGYGVRNA